MGIYDREYVRREGPGFLGSWAEAGSVCKWLIGLTVLLFVGNVVLTDTTSRQLGPVSFYLDLHAPSVLHGEVWRLLTYAFVHDPREIWTILFNMLLLWWFGRDLEEMYGSREFLLFYLVSVLLGGLIFVAFSLTGVLSFPLTGSGVPTAAVLTLCAVHYPRRIIYLFLLLPVPLWLVASILVALNAFVFLSGGAPTAAAVLSAAAFAFAYGRLHWRLSPLWPTLGGWRRLTRPRLRVYREDEPTPVSVSARAQSDEDQLEAKVDAVLEKISRKESLTETEQQLLLRASEHFRRRRR